MQSAKDEGTKAVWERNCHCLALLEPNFTFAEIPMVLMVYTAVIRPAHRSRCGRTRNGEIMVKVGGVRAFV